MFAITKKGLITAVLALIFTAISVASVTAGVTAAMHEETHYATVVLDAGHGGIDGGVVGKSGVKESDINLAMTRILAAELTARNYAVVLTRKTENSFSNVKRADMEARRKIIREADPDCVISLHVNKFRNASRRGAQVFFDDTSVGKCFAERLQSALNTYINDVYGKRADYTALPGDFFITKCVPVPSVIIECGFISNAEDERLLLSDAYRKEIACRVADVLDSIYKTGAAA